MNALAPKFKSLQADNDALTTRYARSRLRNAPVRILFVFLAGSILGTVAGATLTISCVCLVLLSEAVDLRCNWLWGQGKLRNKKILILTAASHAVASSISAIATWLIGGDEIRFLVSMLCGGALLNVGLTIFLFPLGSIIRIVIYLTTLFSLFLTDAFRIIGSDNPKAISAFYLDSMAGVLGMFVVFAFIYSIYRYQRRKAQHEKIIDDQKHSLELEVDRRVRQFEKLAKAKQMAEKAIEAKYAFLTTVSHEIRTPMNGVIGLTELLRDTELDATQRSYVETIRQSGAALLDIINNILDFSKLDANKIELVSKPFDIAQTVADVVTLLSGKHQQSDIEIIMDIDPTLPHYILGDAGKVRQVLINLVGNAIKFTKTGYVYVSAETAMQTDMASYITLEVRDTGIGIPKDQIANIFEEFQQYIPAKGGDYGGTGLGLTITRRLVTLMGGDIQVTSEPDRGSVFSMTLPFQRDQAGSAQPGQHGHHATTLPDLTGRRCLVVDDQHLSLSAILRHLEYWHAGCDVAATGVEALAMIKSKPFDLLIIDEDMEGMSGQDVIRSLDRAGQKIPTILLSKRRAIEPVSNAPVSVVSKPVRPSLLAIETLQVLGLAVAPVVEEAPRTKPGPGPLKAGTKVCVADDNKTNVMLMRSLLQQEPIELHIAENGRKAVDIYKEFTPEIILMDLSMPELDGYEATREIRAFEQAQGLPRARIIAVTAHQADKALQACLAAGMDSCISKPISRVKLFEAIADAQSLPEETPVIMSMSRSRA